VYTRMCPDCPNCRASGSCVVRNGHFFRQSDSGKSKPLAAVIADAISLRSDMHSHYRRVIKKHFTGATHITLKGEKKKNAGQGEVKRGRDPLFSINQTFAMCRAKISRLMRRSWNLSKKKAGFADHMAIDTESYNGQIWERMQKNMQR